MFNQKYKKAIHVIEEEIKECKKMAKWAKERKPERYDAYLEKEVVLEKVLSKIKGKES